MAAVNLTVKAITPLFLGGANPREEPELRAASFRGALRFWLRAALGGVIGDDGEALKQLRCLEAGVFGDTERGSAVVVRVLDQPSGAAVNELNQQGVGYLWFSMKGRNAPNRQAIPAQTPFRLVLQHRSGDTELLCRAAEALWLLTQLGSLGARSRRGAGSLRVMNDGSWLSGVPSPRIQATTPSQLQTDLANGLRQIRANVATWTRTTPSATMSAPQFDVIHPDVCKCWVLDKPFDRWQDALEAVGIAMQAFRVRFPRGDYPGVPDDYANVKAALQGENLAQPVQRAVFGLPIVFYFTSLQGHRDTLEGDDHDRRSSPLIIRVTQLANGKFAVVFTVFYAKLLPDGERLKLKKSRAKVRVPADWSAMDLFLTHVDGTVAPRLEVNYR